MIRPWWGGGPRRGIRSRFEETFVRGEPLPGARPTSPGWHRSFPRRGTGPGPSLIARGRVGDACPARWASADLVRRDMAPRAMVARGPAKGREFRPGRVWGSICVLDDWAGSSPPPAGGRATGKPQSSLPGATHNSSRGPRRYGGLGNMGGCGLWTEGWGWGWGWGWGCFGLRPIDSNRGAKVT
jgi:hypothetical protein